MSDINKMFHKAMVKNAELNQQLKAKDKRIDELEGLLREACDLLTQSAFYGKVEFLHNDKIKEIKNKWKYKELELELKITKLLTENMKLRDCVRHYAGEPFEKNDLYLDIFDLITVHSESRIDFDSITFSAYARKTLKEIQKGE